jgi:hypothetical protein
MMPVSILDTAAACLIVLTILLIAQFAIIAHFEATIVPTSVTESLRGA